MSKERIDWEAFSDCVMCTNWGSIAELERTLTLSHNQAWRVWHGKPVGTETFLRVCKAMRIEATKFLVPA